MGERRTVCINLDRTKERWWQFREQLTPEIESLIGPVERVIGIEPENAGDVPEGVALSPGSWACYQAHLREIDRAIADGVDVLTIFEDDAVFPRDFVERFPEFINAIPKGWHTVYLGGVHKRRPFEVTEQYIRCRDVTLHHAWMLSRIGLRLVSEHLKRYDELALMVHRKHNKDQWCAEGIRRGKFTAYSPAKRWLVGQRAGRSIRNGILHRAQDVGSVRTRMSVSWPAIV